MPPPPVTRITRWAERYTIGADPISWPQIVDDLAPLGYALPATDPGAGSVIGLDLSGRGVVLVSGSQTARAYAAAIARGLVELDGQRG